MTYERCLVPYRQKASGPGRRHRACQKTNIDVHLPSGPETVPVCHTCLETLRLPEVIKRLKSRWERRNRELYENRPGMHQTEQELDEAHFDCLRKAAEVAADSYA